MKTIILKNTTINPMEILGRIVPNAGEEDFSTEPVSLLRSNATLETDILSGDVVVNDGSDDLAPIIGVAYISDTIVLQDDDVVVDSSLTVLNIQGDTIITDEGEHKISIATDQNVWQTITTDSGSASPQSTTDTLNIIGTPSENVTSIVSNTMLIGLDDNIIMPGTEAATIPIGTTAQRPVSPVAGMIRYNTTEGCLEVYDGSWGCMRRKDESVGAVFVLPFSTDGNFQNSWMDFTGNNILTSATPSVMAFRSRIMAITWSNADIGGTIDFEIYRVPEGVEPSVTQDLMFTWSIVTSRTGRRTNFVSDIIFEKGDKIGIYGRKIVSAASNVIITLFMQVMENNDEEVFDTTTEDMTV